MLPCTCAAVCLSGQRSQRAMGGGGEFECDDELAMTTIIDLYNVAPVASSKQPSRVCLRRVKNSAFIGAGSRDHRVPRISSLISFVVISQWPSYSSAHLALSPRTRIHHRQPGNFTHSPPLRSRRPPPFVHRRTRIAAIHSLRPFCWACVYTPYIPRPGLG